MQVDTKIKVPEIDIFTHSYASTSPGSRGGFYRSPQSIKRREVVLSDFLNENQFSKQSRHKSTDKLFTDAKKLISTFPAPLNSPSAKESLSTFRVGQQYLWKTVDKLANYNQNTRLLFQCEKCKHRPCGYQNQLPCRTEPLEHRIVHSHDYRNANCRCQHNHYGQIVRDIGTPIKNNIEVPKEQPKKDIPTIMLNNFSFTKNSKPTQTDQIIIPNSSTHSQQPSSSRRGLLISQIKEFKQFPDQELISILRQVFQYYGIDSLYDWQIKQLIQILKQVSSSNADKKKLLFSRLKEWASRRGQGPRTQTHQTTTETTEVIRSQVVDLGPPNSDLQFRERLNQLMGELDEYDHQIQKKLRNKDTTKAISINSLVQIKNENINNGHDFVNNLDNFISKAQKPDHKNFRGVFESQYFPY